MTVVHCGGSVDAIEPMTAAVVAPATTPAAKGSTYQPEE